MGALLSRGSVSWGLVALSLVSTAPVSAQDPAPVSPVRTLALVCADGTAPVVRIEGADAWVFAPTGTERLTRSEPGGPRFTSPELVLELLDPRIRLERPDAGPVECRDDRRRAVWEHAKLDGASFRAVGNEPGWVLEVYDGERIVLRADYGETTVEVAAPSPVVDVEARVTRWVTPMLTLEVTGRPCADTMSDDTYEATVTVQWGDRTLRGCGRALH